MTSSLHKSIKQILKEIDNFLTCTLRDQTLDKTAQKERTKLIDSLQKLYNDFAEIKPTVEKGDTKPQPNTRLASIGSQPSEEGDSSGDSSIPQTTVTALKQPTKIGYLLQRKPGDGNKKLFKQKKDPKKYCVIHDNAMYWFIKPSDKTFHGAVYLNDCELEDVSRKEKEFVFQLVFSIKNTRYVFQADNKEDFNEWRKAVETGIQCGKQKEADAVDGIDPYPCDAVSTRDTSGEISRINETEDDSVYTEPDSTLTSDDSYKRRAEVFRSSMPRVRPPSPPKADIEPVQLPLTPQKGKAQKETKPEKSKKAIKAVPSDANSKHLAQNKAKTLFSSAGKPKTLSEVKLKPVTMPRDIKLCDEEFEDDEQLYETIEAIKPATGHAGGMSAPDSKPPILPQRNENMYVNEVDNDNLIYELD